MRAAEIARSSRASGGTLNTQRCHRSSRFVPSLPGAATPCWLPRACRGGSSKTCLRLRSQVQLADLRGLWPEELRGQPGRTPREQTEEVITSLKNPHLTTTVYRFVHNYFLGRSPPSQGGEIGSHLRPDQAAGVVLVTRRTSRPPGREGLSAPQDWTLAPADPFRSRRCAPQGGLKPFAHQLL